MTKLTLTRILIPGQVQGPCLVFDEPISFWGGINPLTGCVIDRQHPQLGLSIKDSILFLPGTRGSTAGPGALLETLYLGNGPAAIVLTKNDLATLIAATASVFINSKTIVLVEYFADLAMVNTGQSIFIDCINNSMSFKH